MVDKHIEYLKKRMQAEKSYGIALKNMIHGEPSFRKSLEHNERIMAKQDGFVDEESVKENVDKLMVVSPYKLEVERAKKDRELAYLGRL